MYTWFCRNLLFSCQSLFHFIPRIQKILWYKRLRVEAYFDVKKIILLVLQFICLQNCTHDDEYKWCSSCIYNKFNLCDLLFKIILIPNRLFYFRLAGTEQNGQAYARKSQPNTNPPSNGLSRGNIVAVEPYNHVPLPGSHQIKTIPSNPEEVCIYSRSLLSPTHASEKNAWMSLISLLLVVLNEAAGIF